MCEITLFELELKNKEELIEIIKTIKKKLDELISQPKTSKAQIKASNKYLKEHPMILKESQKRYYKKKALDPEWLAEQSRLQCERYHKSN